MRRSSFVYLTLTSSLALPFISHAQDLGSINPSTSQMDINQASQCAVINWQSFDSNAKVQIIHPNQAAVLLNRVFTNNPSEIFSETNANRQFALLNPYSVNGDGSVIVGEMYLQNGNSYFTRAFSWTAATVITNLGVLNGGNWSSASNVSGNGLVIVGAATDGADNNSYRAYRWTNETGMQTVEKWLSDNGVQVDSGLKTNIAYATNTDGSVVVGELANKHGFIARVNSTNGNGLIDTANYASSLQAYKLRRRFPF